MCAPKFILFDYDRDSRVDNEVSLEGPFFLFTPSKVLRCFMMEEMDL